MRNMTQHRLYIMIKIVAPIEPVAWPRPQFNSRTGAVYNSERYSDYKDALKIFAAQAMRGRPPLTGEVKLYAEFFKRKPRPNPRAKCQVSFVGDTDRYLNAVLDALEGICYFNDRQIIDVRGVKIFGEPQVKIEVEEV